MAATATLPRPAEPSTATVPPTAAVTAAVPQMPLAALLDDLAASKLEIDTVRVREHLDELAYLHDDGYGPRRDTAALTALLRALGGAAAAPVGYDLDPTGRLVTHPRLDVLESFRDCVAVAPGRALVRLDASADPLEVLADLSGDAELRRVCAHVRHLQATGLRRSTAYGQVLAVCFGDRPVAGVAHHAVTRQLLGPPGSRGAYADRIEGLFPDATRLQGTRTATGPDRVCVMSARRTLDRLGQIHRVVLAHGGVVRAVLSGHVVLASFAEEADRSAFDRVLLDAGFDLPTGWG